MAFVRYRNDGVSYRVKGSTGDMEAEDYTVRISPERLSVQGRNYKCVVHHDRAEIVIWGELPIPQRCLILANALDEIRLVQSRPRRYRGAACDGSSLRRGLQ